MKRPTTTNTKNSHISNMHLTARTGIRTTKGDGESLMLLSSSNSTSSPKINILNSNSNSNSNSNNNNNNNTVEHKKDDSKLFRRPMDAFSSSSSFFSFSSFFLKSKLMMRRMRHYWALLSTGSKVATTLVVLFLLQHVLLGLWDNAFHQIGTNSQHQYPNSQQQQQQQPPNMRQKKETSFVVAINTYKRPDMLQNAVQHYAETCGPKAGVSQVFVIWAEQDAPEIPTPESFFYGASSTTTTSTTTSTNTNTGSLRNKNQQSATSAAPPFRSEVIILKKSKDSLNSRFEPIAELQSSSSSTSPTTTTTTSVFMVDDDVRIACPSLLHAFDAWNANPDSMVGYYPRLASPPRNSPSPSSSTSSSSSSSSSSSKEELVYHTWPIVYWQHELNFILTKACFLHSKYLELYTSDVSFPKKVKDFVDDHKNCEDIAMSMLVANYTRMNNNNNDNNDNNNNMPAPPIYVEGSITDLGLFGGISTGSGHMATRSECLTQLTAILQQHGWESPLAYKYALDLRKSSWIQHAPGFWWQSRPSNVFEWFSLGNIMS